MAARSRRPEVSGQHPAPRGRGQEAMTRFTLGLWGSAEIGDMRMGDEGDQRGARRDKAHLIDVTVPNAMRAADFLDGGKNNFTADREAVRAITASAPAIERIPAEARAFRHRVIKY